MSDSKTSDIVAVTALVISIISFVATFAQVIQQYLASADGYRRCAESVMGLWARGTHRRFRKSEMRFEVVFETPILFTAKPDNERGPVRGREIINVEGSPGSFARTLTMEPREQESADRKAGENVHTADDERASWVNLLAKLQAQERESRAWESKNLCTPRGSIYEVPQYTLCVQLQKKVRSWDFMPSAVQKPFATTTICHLVEMAAMLGMTWKAFDPDSWNLRAEGNGFIITSSLVQGQGLMLTFAITGKSVFTDKRTIPCLELKELCFGTVPTILKHDLNWGTTQEVTRTLEFLGCSADTISKYHKQKESHFPVTFEIIGMLAEVFRIHSSNFKMIPNPTQVVWNRGFNFIALMEEFFDLLGPLIQNGTESSQVRAIWHAWQNTIRPVWEQSEHSIDIDLREALHDSIDAADAFLGDSDRRGTVLSVIGAHITIIQANLDDVDSTYYRSHCNTEEGFMKFYFDSVRCWVSGLINAGQPGLDKLLKLPAEDAAQRNEIWLTLIFRMIAWYLLHDFDKDDVLILPSRLKGSRLPVYIS